REKVIVLMSDGGFTGKAEDLAAVTQELAARHIRLIIVGLGMPTAIPIPVYDEQGQLTGYFKKDDKVVTTAIEEPAPLPLSAPAGGQYIHLTNDKDLNIQWASTLAGSKVEPKVRHVYQYPLSVALALLFALSLRGLIRRKDTI